MVTHNEMFLHALAERLMVFQDDGIRLFEGSYTSFLKKHGWDEERTEKKAPAKTGDNYRTRGKLTKKEARKKRSELVAERGKLLNPLKKHIKAENDIENQEKRLKVLNQEMMDAQVPATGDRLRTYPKKSIPATMPLKSGLPIWRLCTRRKTSWIRSTVICWRDRRLRVA